MMTPLRLFCISAFAGVLLLLSPAPEARAQEVKILAPWQMRNAPQRLWAKSFVFKDVLVERPTGKSIKISDKEYYEFETKGLGKVYALEDMFDKLNELELDQGYVFRGTVLNREKMISFSRKGRYCFVIDGVIRALEEASPVKEAITRVVTADTRAMGSDAEQIMSKMLTEVQSTLAAFATQEGIAYEALFDPASEYSVKSLDVIRNQVSSLQRNADITPTELLAQFMKLALDQHHGATSEDYMVPKAVPGAGELFGPETTEPEPAVEEPGPPAEPPVPETEPDMGVPEVDEPVPPVAIPEPEVEPVSIPEVDEPVPPVDIPAPVTVTDREIEPGPEPEVTPEKTVPKNKKTADIEGLSPDTLRILEAIRQGEGYDLEVYERDESRREPEPGTKKKRKFFGLFGGKKDTPEDVEVREEPMVPDEPTRAAPARLDPISERVSPDLPDTMQPGVKVKKNDEGYYDPGVDYEFKYLPKK